MRLASRYMPSYDETLTLTSRLIVGSILSVLGIGYIYVIWIDPMSIVFIWAVVFLASISYLFSDNNLKILLEQREDEDIGTFARSLDYRSIDTWIIRAVYEEINSELGFKDNTLPIRASDNLAKDLKLDDEDLFFIYNRVATRAGISDEDIEKNPYYNRVETVEDMILFLNTQPRV